VVRNVLHLLAAVAAVSSGILGCGPPPKSGLAPPPPPKAAAPGTTKVTAFAVSPESLNVDKVGMRDGQIVPDGNRDLVFTATVEGPADALFLVNCSDKGEPLQGFRADTIVGHEELPPELGSVVDVGRLTVWVAVVENGKFINNESGTLGMLPVGTHQVKLYVPNTGTLRGGTHLRLYARGPSTGLVGGPVVPY
jgi:hypothetical protein